MDNLGGTPGEDQGVQGVAGPRRCRWKPVGDSPTRIAKVAVFLACDDASYVTGVELFVDSGGMAQV